jgi:hypothetical protein
MLQEDGDSCVMRSFIIHALHQILFGKNDDHHDSDDVWGM